MTSKNTILFDMDGTFLVFKVPIPEYTDTYENAVAAFHRNFREQHPGLAPHILRVGSQVEILVDCITTQYWFSQLSNIQGLIRDSFSLPRSTLWSRQSLLNRTMSLKIVRPDQPSI